MEMKHIEILLDLINELATQIVQLKENECQNSGLNWHDEWVKNFPYPSDFKN